LAADPTSMSVTTASKTLIRCVVIEISLPNGRRLNVLCPAAVQPFIALAFVAECFP
jgi:hypothetical protein